MTQESPSSADVAKLVDAPDLGSGAERRGGSSPFIRTIYSHIFQENKFHSTNGSGSDVFFLPVVALWF